MGNIAGDHWGEDSSDYLIFICVCSQESPTPMSNAPTFFIVQLFTVDVPAEALLFAFDTPCKCPVMMGFLTW